MHATSSSETLEQQPVCNSVKLLTYHFRSGDFHKSQSNEGESDGKIQSRKPLRSLRTESSKNLVERSVNEVHHRRDQFAGVVVCSGKAPSL